VDSPTPLRTVREHARRAVALVEPLPVVDLPLDEVVGTVLARDLVALLDLPPFDAAAMDGYALRRADAGNAATLRVVGEVAAGSARVGAVATGEAVRIMTGAPVPAGADVVVPVERTSTGTFTPDDGGAHPDTADVTVPALTPDDRAHVRRRGEDVAAGEVVAPAGTVVTARLAALAAALGHATLAVRRPPTVAVLSTGDELTPAGEPLAPGRIPDSNSVYLRAAVASRGAEEVAAVHVARDDEAALAEALDAAAGEADLVVSTGGVGPGTHDLAGRFAAATPRGVLARVAMRPGRPQAPGTWNGTPWLALPGNPTAAFVSFEAFVRPVLARLAGGPSAQGTAAETVSVGWPGRSGVVRFVPLSVGDGARSRPSSLPWVRPVTRRTRWRPCSARRSSR